MWQVACLKDRGLSPALDRQESTSRLRFSEFWCAECIETASFADPRLEARVRGIQWLGCAGRCRGRRSAGLGGRETNASQGSSAWTGAMGLVGRSARTLAPLRRTSARTAAVLARGVSVTAPNRSLTASLVASDRSWRHRHPGRRTPASTSRYAPGYPREQGPPTSRHAVPAQTLARRPPPGGVPALCHSARRRSRSR